MEFKGEDQNNELLGWSLKVRIGESEIDHRANALALMHQVKGLVDIG